ncbi:uncharacterized protein B0I36DRAFT_314119 [Microdochium trichocladiopsis]|uniref:Uncharacterized protein n=1 Tax=Microdochium trichocladiopsis TaxID=1682393 RepID=A0A9P8YGE2_9PEZI|nr:uncharacterized protein B0I36DRAFT_314119 [Microdochium trichocladiopsis]KAH7037463.1 hypothetical protein B0I36DRAFT_314119 [Microdochium trichocladiopsis]
MKVKLCKQTASGLRGAIARSYSRLGVPGLHCRHLVGMTRGRERRERDRVGSSRIAVSRSVVVVVGLGIHVRLSHKQAGAESAGRRGPFRPNCQQTGSCPPITVHNRTQPVSLWHTSTFSRFPALSSPTVCRPLPPSASFPSSRSHERSAIQRQAAATFSGQLNRPMLDTAEVT